MILKKFFSLLLVFLGLISSVGAFSLDDIISPKEGEWSNLQTLSLNPSPEDREIYYSIDNSDPYEKGFVYQQEVVLPLRGNITLKIAVFNRAGERQDFERKFTVKEFSGYKKGDARRNFIEELNRRPLYTLWNGYSLNIPEGLKACLGGKKEFLQDIKSIKVKPDSLLSQKTNLVLSDGENTFSYVLKMVPLIKKGWNRKKLPFRINDWNEIIFTDNTYSYFLDNKKVESESVKINRDENHIISWKKSDNSDDTEEGSFILKEIPALDWTRKTDGSLEVKLISSDENYFICGQEDNYKSYKIIDIPVKSFCIDLMETDQIYFNENLKIFYDGIYQGTLNFNSFIDKRAAGNPIFISSVQAGFSRQAVNLTIKSDEEKEIYYSVSPSVSRSDDFYGKDKSYFDHVKDGDFQLYQGETIYLFSENKDASYYRLRAYAVDENGIKSNIETIEFIVDQYNYFFNPSKKFKKDDSYPPGSYQNPFTDFTTALNYVNNESNLRLHVMCDLSLKNYNLNLTKDISLEGINSRITLDENSKIQISNAAVKFKNIRFNQSVKSGNSSFISVKNGSVFLENVTVDYSLQSGAKENLYGIYSTNSEVDVKNCIFNINGNDEACFIWGKNSKVSVLSANLTAKAGKVNGIYLISSVGIFISSTFVIDCSSGDCIHLEKCSSSLSSNKFILTKNKYKKIDNNSKNPPRAFYKDKSTSIIEYINNMEKGF